MILKVEGLVKSFGNFEVIHHWNLTVEEGEKVVLLGPSGCGKTTFLRIIAGLEKPTEGKIEIGFERLGFVFQEPRLIPWKTVRDNLRLIEEDEGKIKTILELVKLNGFEDHFPSQISGGMKQRLNLARAMVVDPDFMILDEPFTSLDIKVKMEIMEDLMEIWEKRRFTMLMVTHDVKEAVYMGDRILILSKIPSKILREIRINFIRRDITNRDFLGMESRILRFMLE
ncbi:MAG: ABC transporter ATP-binding protein [Thermotoga sp.]|nr:MAG: ABC transporter ATP-binding protein [Thermotoga sp.]HDM70694.1 ABC transporter ATP-binding protein [Thermotogales bacterium]